MEKVDLNDLNILDNFSFIAGELIIAGLIFLLIERLKPAHTNFKFFSKEFKKEIGLAVINGTIFNPVFNVALTFVVVVALQKYLPYQLLDKYITPLPITLQAFIGMFIIDLGTYWRHRFTHNYAWRFHSIHHSAEEITWITALRLHPVDVLFAVIVDTFILHMIGFSGAGIVFAALLGGIYNFFTHANINLEYPKPFQYIFVSPNFHRWHHATNKEAYDKNFAATFSLIDLMFGTYYYPEGKIPEAYGLSPAEQKDVPPGLLQHLIHPFKKKKR